MWLIVPVLALALLVLFVVGLVAAVLATAALVVGILVHALPFLLILFGAWLLFRPRRRRAPIRHYPDAPRSGAWGGSYRRPGPRQAAQPRPAPPRPSPPTAPSTPARELPIDVQVKVDQIRRKADVLLGYADRFPPFSQDLHIVRQTTADYLPRTINAYLAIPGANDPLLSASSTAALDELRGQLELLDSKLDEIVQNLQRHDLDQLLANRRFLEERFGLRDQPATVKPVRDATDAA